MGRGTRRVMVTMAPPARETPVGQGHPLGEAVRVFHRRSYDRGRYYQEPGISKEVRVLTSGDPGDSIQIGNSDAWRPSDGYTHRVRVRVGRQELRPFARWLCAVAEAAERDLDAATIKPWKGESSSAVPGKVTTSVQRIDTTTGLVTPTIVLGPEKASSGVVSQFHLSPAIARALAYDCLVLDRAAGKNNGLDHPMSRLEFGTAPRLARSAWPASLQRMMREPDLSAPSTAASSLADAMRRSRD